MPVNSPTRGGQKLPKTDFENCVVLGLSDRATAKMLSEKYGIKVTHRDVGRIRKGIEPSLRNPGKRHALGLPVTVPIAVCPLHGIVHEKRCPGAEPKPRKPRRNWRGLALVLAGLLVNQK